MKKMVWVAGMATLFIIVLTGCESQRNPSQPVGKTESYSYASDGTANMQQGIYIGDDQLIHYYDIALQQETILCSKPDCKHAPYDEDKNPDPTCEAALESTLINSCYPILSDEYVYLIGIENISNGVLYRQKLDGSERKKIGCFPYIVQEGARCYVRNHIAYITASIPIIQKDKLGGVGSNKSHSVLIALDLTTAEFNLLSEQYEYEWQDLNLVGMEKDKLYYEFSYAKKQKRMEDYQTAKTFRTVYCYNMQQKKTQIICSPSKSDGYESIGILDGKLCMYSKKSNAVFLYDESKKEMKQIYKAQPGEISFLSTEKYLFILGEKKTSLFCDNKKTTMNQKNLICNCFGKWIVTWEKTGTDCGVERIITVEQFLKMEQ